MERFYLRQEYHIHQLVHLFDPEHHHLKVMRLRLKEEIELVNGDGSLAIAHIQAIEKEHTVLKILKLTKQDPLPRQISLGIPFMRPSKLEWIVEKGTEIGADAFFLYPAHNSIPKVLSVHQIERLNSIIISALKQSKRLYLPRLEILPHLESLLKKEATIFFGDTRDEAPAFKASDGDILFMTGPESGFTQKEVDLLSQSGIGVRLNLNVLRAETAPLVALTLICAC